LFRPRMSSHFVRVIIMIMVSCRYHHPACQ
jgi:hypothetical protein